MSTDQEIQYLVHDLAAWTDLTLDEVKADCKATFELDELTDELANEITRVYNETKAL